MTINRGPPPPGIYRSHSVMTVPKKRLSGWNSKQWSEEENAFRKLHGIGAGRLSFRHPFILYHLLQRLYPAAQLAYVPRHTPGRLVFRAEYALSVSFRFIEQRALPASTEFRGPTDVPICENHRVYQVACFAHRSLCNVPGCNILSLTRRLSSRSVLVFDDPSIGCMGGNRTAKLPHIRLSGFRNGLGRWIVSLPNDDARMVVRCSPSSRSLEAPC